MKTKTMAMSAVLFFPLVFLCTAEVAGRPLQTAPSMMGRCQLQQSNDGSTISLSHSDGRSLEMRRAPDGRPLFVRYLRIENGTPVVVASENFVSDPSLRPPLAGAAPDDGQGTRWQTQRAILRAFVERECAFAVHRGTGRGGLSYAWDDDVDSSMRDPDNNAWDDWTESDFMQFADYTVSVDFSEGIEEFWKSRDRDNLPSCRDLINYCTEDCNALRDFSMTACAALGTAAAVVSAGVGASVGVYCSGEVWTYSRACATSCRKPKAPCK